jgi:hypothetical protein
LRGERNYQSSSYHFFLDGSGITNPHLTTFLGGERSYQRTIVTKQNISEYLKTIIGDKIPGVVEQVLDNITKYFTELLHECTATEFFHLLYRALQRQNSKVYGM